MTMISNNTSPIDLVVFDMAGTTVFDGDAVHRCLAAAMAEIGYKTTREEINRVMGISKPLAIKILIELKNELSEDASQEAIDRAYDFFSGMMIGFYRSDRSVREIPGTTEVFRTLKSHGIKIALDSGFSRPIIDIVLERLGWVSSGLVDATVATDEVEHGRPDPDMIYKAMFLTGTVDVKRVAKVGDTPADLLEGDSAGCGLVIGVTSGSHTSQELAIQPHTHLIDSVADLLTVLQLMEDKR